MIEAITKGILLGIFVSFLIGPVFFGLIQTSIRQGIGRAMIYEIGTITSDTFVITLCYLGLAPIFERESYKYAIAIIGAVILFLFGLYPFIIKKKKPETNNEPEIIKSSAFALISKSFLLNTINPSVIVFWIVWVGFGVSNFGSKSSHLWGYFISILGTMILFDFLKAFGANKIKKYLKPKTFILISKIEGVLLIIFSAVILIRTFFFS